MPNAIIFHCRGGTPDDFWYPWLRDRLIERGYAVQIPAFPDSEPSPLTSWLPYALRHCTFDEQTVLVGHSSGATLILSVLEHLPVRIRQAVLVSGFSEPLTPGDYGADPILQRSYDWEIIRAHAADFVFVNSDNDPFGCDDTAGRRLLDHLGGTLVVPHAQGHMGSFSYNQPHKEFPLLARLID